MHGWVQSSLELSRELWWKCATFAECKIDRSVVLTIKSGLDPHMINELKNGFNIAFRLFLWPCWVPTISVLILAYVVQRRTLERSTSSTTRSSEACDPPFRCLWKMKMESRLHCYCCSCKDLRVYPRECNKVNKPFLYVLSNVLWYYTHLSIICVKCWSWRTYEMHSVFFEKRVWQLADRCPASCPTCVLSIFIMLSTWWLGLPTSVTLLSMFSNTLSPALNFANVSLLILAC
jgi:hypothetical protein